jgi:hypothetical protein
MEKRKKSYVLLAYVFVLAAGGFIASFWPLEALGVLIAALLGYPVYAVGVGILLDLAYGAPTGHLHPLLFPMTVLALLGLIARHWGKRYFFDASAQDTL